jgi:hypothetical protein
MWLMLEGQVERIYTSSIYRCYFVLGNPDRILGHGSAEGGLPSYPQFCSLNLASTSSSQRNFASRSHTCMVNWMEIFKPSEGGKTKIKGKPKITHPQAMFQGRL